MSLSIILPGMIRRQHHQPVKNMNQFDFAAMIQLEFKILIAMKRIWEPVFLKVLQFIINFTAQ
jgi:hypothetical protein